MLSSRFPRWCSTLVMSGIVAVLVVCGMVVSRRVFPEGGRPRPSFERDGAAFFSIGRPMDYTAETFASSLHERLTPEEVARVVNPLTETPQMDQWARNLTSGATTDLEKARMLYNVLIFRVDTKPAQFAQPPTAQEVFAAWHRQGASFACQDLAFLYVALARGVGVSAYPAFVEEDCHGIKLLHSCAAVFVGAKAFLVDPAYLSFGVAHRKFTLLDDLQASAVYLCGLPSLQQCQIGNKLAPDLSIVRAALFEMEIREGRWKEAEDQLALIMRADPEGPVTYSARARMAGHRGQLETAVALLRKAIEIAPPTDEPYMSLGMVYGRLGKWGEARECYNNALRYAVYQRTADAARAGIAFIGGQECLANGAWEGALSNFSKVIEIEPGSAEAYGARGIAKRANGDMGGALADLTIAINLKPDFAQAYLDRGATKQAQGDVAGAESDYSRAIELRPDLAQAYMSRGTARYVEGEMDGALADYNRAIQLSSETGPVLKMLGCLRYDRHEFPEALATLRRACELGGEGDYTHLRIWLTRSRLGETELATRELRSYLERRVFTQGADWSSMLGRFLIGQITEEDLLKAAPRLKQKSDADQFRDAYFYIGMKHLIGGDRTAAAEYLGKCVSGDKAGEGAVQLINGQVMTLMEYASARAELRFLGTRPPGP